MASGRARSGALTVAFSASLASRMYLSSTRLSQMRRGTAPRTASAPDSRGDASSSRRTGPAREGRTPGPAGEGVEERGGLGGGGPGSPCWPQPSGRAGPAPGRFIQSCGGRRRWCTPPRPPRAGRGQTSPGAPQPAAPLRPAPPARGGCSTAPPHPPGVPGRAAPRGSLNPAPRSIPAQTLTARPHLRKPAGRPLSVGGLGPAPACRVACARVRGSIGSQRGAGVQAGGTSGTAAPAGRGSGLLSGCVRAWGDGGGGCVREGPPEVRVPPGQRRGADAAHAAR